jgi:tRNA 2-thiouridine synthesizing protein D
MSKIDTLFLVGHGKDNGEKATIPFVLANIEAEKPGRTVEVILIFDGVVMALPGNAAGFNIGVPFESFDLEGRMKEFQKKGGIINVCTPCLAHRGLAESPVLEGIVRIKGPDLLEKKDLANKILSFT